MLVIAVIPFLSGKGIACINNSMAAQQPGADCIIIGG
jgi:hypothetical protein